MKLARQNTAAFTMIEIAIAIGVIAFALIAIIGVLPAGMHVNRDNRHDTIINHDSAYLLEAIRNSAEDIPDLAAFCESMRTQAGVLLGTPATNFTSFDIITNLCTPGVTNLTVFRPITGPAVSRAADVPTFRYLLRSEIRQIDNVNPDLPQAQFIEKNQYEVRLVFLWPVLPNGEPAEAAQRQVIRTTITGTYDVTNGVFNSTEFRK